MKRFPVKQMKWWGWGNVDESFDVTNRPHFNAYVGKHLGMDVDQIEIVSPVDLESIKLRPSNVSKEFLSALENRFETNKYTMDHKERIIHSYGKSFRDLYRMRRGIISRAPDIVLYPENESDVVSIVMLAHEHDVIVIPFGGGSNIAGCVEANTVCEKTILSLDMKVMNNVKKLDTDSHYAVIEAGSLGPDLEEQLNALGYSLGHFPDSFKHSTLGGWVATRSAGLQSDVYGKIEDMVLAIKMVTPQGVVETRVVPKCSNGIDVNSFFVGSEGILGVITEVTVAVHPIAESREIYGYLFHDFESGVNALKEISDSEITPLFMRLNDINKTGLSFAFKEELKGSPFKNMVTEAFKFYLQKIKRIDFDTCCMLLIGYEGKKHVVDNDIRRSKKIFHKYRAASLGTSPAASFEKTKYDFPYVRDYVMDRGFIADVSETATTWKNLLPLYYSVKKNINQAIKSTGSEAWCGCHISHTYHSGASLYFTFVAEQSEKLGIEQYLYIKKAAEDAFIDGGGTLSHHHAVGYEHIPWIEKEVSATAMGGIKSLKQGLDPKGIMNPGKIIASECFDWGLSAATNNDLNG